MSFHVVNGMEYEGQEASYYFTTTYLLLYTPDNNPVRLISTYYILLSIFRSTAERWKYVSI